MDLSHSSHVCAKCVFSPTFCSIQVKLLPDAVSAAATQLKILSHTKWKTALNTLHNRTSIYSYFLDNIVAN